MVALLCVCVHTAHRCCVDLSSTERCRAQMLSAARPPAPGGNTESLTRLLYTLYGVGASRKERVLLKQEAVAFANGDGGRACWLVCGVRVCVVYENGCSLDNFAHSCDRCRRAVALRLVSNASKKNTTKKLGLFCPLSLFSLEERRRSLLEALLVEPKLRSSSRAAASTRFLGVQTNTEEGDARAASDCESLLEHTPRVLDQGAHAHSLTSWRPPTWLPPRSHGGSGGAPRRGRGSE